MPNRTDRIRMTGRACTMLQVAGADSLALDLHNAAYNDSCLEADKVAEMIEAVHYSATAGVVSVRTGAAVQEISDSPTRIEPGTVPALLASSGVDLESEGVAELNRYVPPHDLMFGDGSPTARGLAESFEAGPRWPEDLIRSWLYCAEPVDEPEPIDYRAHVCDCESGDCWC